MKHTTKLLVLITAVAGALAMAGAGWAYWTASGSGSASASVGTLAAPTIGSSSSSGSTVSLGWGAVTAPGAGSVSYYVSRDGSAAGGDCPRSSLPTSVTSCLDTGVPGGSHSYTVTAVYRSWTATSIAASVTVSSVGPLDHFAVTVPAGLTAGTPFSATITARDAADRTVTSYSGAQNIVLTGPDNAPDGTHPNLPSSVTFTGGVGSAQVTLYKAESPTLTATQNAITGSSGNFTVSPATASSLSLSAASTTPTAGAADNLTITAKDTYGNTATAYTGSKNLTFGGANTIGSNNPKVTNNSGTAINFGSATAITFASGVATVSGSNNGVMTLPKAETVSIVVSDGAVSNGAGLSLTVSPAGAASLTVSGFASPTTAGLARNVAVTAKDPFNNTATGYTGTVALSSTDAQAVLPGNYTFVAGDNGTHNLSVSLKTAGLQSITATDTVTSSITGSQLGITVNAGSVAGLAITNASGQPLSGLGCATISSNYSCVKNGAGNNPSLTGYVSFADAFGNPVSFSTSNQTIALAASTGSVSPTSVLISGSGTTSALSFTASNSGNHSVVMTAKLSTTFTVSLTLNP